MNTNEFYRVTFHLGRLLVDGKRWEDLNWDQKQILEQFIHWHRIAVAETEEA